jgi:hypothetical protein
VIEIWLGLLDWSDVGFDLEVYDGETSAMMVGFNLVCVALMIMLEDFKIKRKKFSYIDHPWNV